MASSADRNWAPAGTGNVQCCSAHARCRRSPTGARGPSGRPVGQRAPAGAVAAGHVGGRRPVGPESATATASPPGLQPVARCWSTGSAGPAPRLTRGSAGYGWTRPAGRGQREEGDLVAAVVGVASSWCAAEPQARGVASQRVSRRRRGVEAGSGASGCPWPGRRPCPARGTGAPAGEVVAPGFHPAMVFRRVEPPCGTAGPTAGVARRRRRPRSVASSPERRSRSGQRCRRGGLPRRWWRHERRGRTGRAHVQQEVSCTPGVAGRLVAAVPPPVGPPAVRRLVENPDWSRGSRPRLEVGRSRSAGGRSRGDATLLLTAGPRPSRPARLGHAGLVSTWLVPTSRRSRCWRCSEADAAAGLAGRALNVHRRESAAARLTDCTTRHSDRGEPGRPPGCRWHVSSTGPCGHPREVLKRHRVDGHAVGRAAPFSTEPSS